MELKEYIYKLCTDTDMTDPEAATELAQTLSMNLLRLDSVCKKTGGQAPRSDEREGL